MLKTNIFIFLLFEKNEIKFGWLYNNIQIKSMTTAKFSFMNMLADSLSNDGFICNDPESIKWDVRGPKIVAMLSKCFDEGCDAVGVVECDHPFSILEKLQREGRPIYATIQRVRSKINVNNGYNQLLERGFPLDKKNKVRVPVENPLTTFMTEINNHDDCSVIVSLMNTDRGNAELVPTLTENSSYVFDYCNVIFWNPAIIDSSPAYSELNPSSTRGYKCFIGKGDGGFIQRFDKNGVCVLVLTAHLKSGEGEKEEAERVTALRPLLSVLSAVDNSVVLMDSNSSQHYKEGIPYNLDNVIEEGGFKKVLSENCEDPDDGLVCVKMRAAVSDGKRGGQPPKFGEFMFDRIDQILVRSKMNATMLSGDPHYPKIYNGLLYKIRTTKLLRERVSNWVLDWHNVFDHDGNFIASGDSSLRLNNKNFEPVWNKDKTILLKKMTADISSMWCDNARHNAYVGFADYLQNGPSDMVLYDIEGDIIPKLIDDDGICHPEDTYDLSMYDISDYMLKDMFSYMYPNASCPSDHPLLTAVVELVC